MGCGTACVKVLLITFNMLFWLFGLGLLAIGVWLKVDTQVANLGAVLDIGLDEDILDIGSWVLIGAGLCAFIVGFVGCCGAVQESPCLLGFYLTSLVLIFAAEIAVAIFVGVKFDALEKDVEKAVKNWLSQEYDGGESIASKGFNYLQMDFCCCGVMDYRDYKGSKFLREHSEIRGNASMSYACCKHDGENEDTSQDGVRNINAADKQKCEDKAIELTLKNSEPETPDDSCSLYFRQQGCKDALIEWAKQRMPILIGVGAGVAALQIFVFAIAICLCRNVQNKKED